MWLRSKGSCPGLFVASKMQELQRSETQEDQEEVKNDGDVAAECEVVIVLQSGAVARTSVDQQFTSPTDLFKKPIWDLPVWNDLGRKCYQHLE